MMFSSRANTPPWKTVEVSIQRRTKAHYPSTSFQKALMLMMHWVMSKPSVESFPLINLSCWLNGW